MPFEVREFQQGRTVHVGVHNTVTAAHREALHRGRPVHVGAHDTITEVHRAALPLPSAPDGELDTAICQRCLRTATRDASFWDCYECPNCGNLEWRWLRPGQREKPLFPMVVEGGHFPVAPMESTGYFIDNPHPGAGLRVPAKLWVPRRTP